MKDNPPAKEDAPMVAKMAKIGIVPGKDFDMSKLDPAVAKALEGVPKAGLEKIMGHFKNAGTNVNGWVSSDQDRDLRHRLPAAGLHHRHRPRRQPAPGRSLSDLRGGRRRQAL